MKILIGMHHPKQFWMFKYLIQEGKNRDWKFKILISKKDVLENLLKSAKIEYRVIGKNQPTILKKIFEMNKMVIRSLPYVKKFDPDLFIGQAIPHFSFISALRNRPYFIYEDTESVKWLHKITIPYSDVIITPTCFRRNLGKKHLKINTYFELAYLHPNWFKPNPDILDELGVGKKDKYVVIRFISWAASHDIGQIKTTNKEKIRLIENIEKFAIPVITSEDRLPKELEKFRIKIPLHRIHDALYFATMYIGEGGTMATEASLLGTPSILVNPQAKYCGNHQELKNKYKLQLYFDDFSVTYETLIKLLKNKNIKKIWKKRLDQMLNEKIDMTKYIIDFIEDYKKE